MRVLKLFSITLILVVSKDVATQLDTCYLLEMVFGAMVLLIGLQELEDINSKVERLKNELKVMPEQFIWNS